MLAGSGSIIAGRGSTVAIRGSRFTVRGWRFAVRGSRFRRSGAGPMSIDAGCGECRVGTHSCSTTWGTSGAHKGTWSLNTEMSVELTPGVVVRTNACVRSRLWRAFVHAGCGYYPPLYGCGGNQSPYGHKGTQRAGPHVGVPLHSG